MPSKFYFITIVCRGEKCKLRTFRKTPEETIYYTEKTPKERAECSSCGRSIYPSSIFFLSRHYILYIGI